MSGSPAGRLAFVPAICALVLAACAATDSVTTEDAERHVRAGFERLDAKNPQSAMREFRRAQHDDPQRVDAVAGEARALVALGRNDEAIVAYDRAIELRPTASAYCARADLHAEQKRWSASIDDLSRALELRPQWGSTLEMRARMWRRLGDRTRAEQDLRTALRVDPAWTAHFQLGQLLFVAGAFDESAEELRLAARGSLDGGYVSLLAYAARRRAGQDPVDAQKELLAHRKLLAGAAWPSPLLDFTLGTIGIDALALARDRSAESDPRRRACEFAFYVGEWHLWNHGLAAARARLQEAVAACPETHEAFDLARAEVDRLAF